MMNHEPSIPLLERALDQTGALIRRVRPEQSTAPTPCGDWNLRELVNHVVVDLQQFTRMAQGERYQAGAADVLGDNWSASYAAAATALLDAWRAPGAVDRQVKLPFGEFPATWQIGQQITDVAVHAWDIAHAANLPLEVDDEIVSLALQWGRANLKPEFRGAAFGPEVPAPANATPYDELAAFFGRHPEQPIRA